MRDSQRIVSIPFALTVSTANNGITSILNTTLRKPAPDYAITAPSTQIGNARGELLNWWLVVPYLYFTAQNVTLTFQTLINGAWAAALDVPTGYVGGANVITASASPQAGFSWRLYGDSNVFLTNGAAGPAIGDIGSPYLTNIDPKGNP